MLYDRLLREIRSKRVIIYRRGPFPQDVKEFLAAEEERDWILMHLRLEGSVLTDEDLARIRAGGYVLNATVEEHLLVQRLSELRSFIYRLTEGGAALSVQLLEDMHGILTGRPEEKASQRDALTELVRSVRAEEVGEDPLKKAAGLHDRLRQLAPFPSDNAMTARAAMFYWLVGRGYPLAPLVMSREDYEAAYSAYCLGQGSVRLAESVGQALFVKLEEMIRLTAYQN